MGMLKSQDRAITVAAQNARLTRRGFAAALVAGAMDVRPNILWITCEDIGPALGCYGDKYADSPNIDQLAARGMMYRNAWSNAPVCAPARTTIISGVYPPSCGAEHMRSMTRLPASMKMYPCFLEVWEESSKKAPWRKRKPGQPFMSVFNLLITHESQIRTRPHTWVHDPAKARLPAYHPDTPEVRQDWAQYYDNITTMDGQAGRILKQLEDDGLSDSTIIFFYGDHGSGMPRSKRWPFNSGLQVPLIVYVPEKFKSLAPTGYKAGGTSDRPVGFVDLAPTVLSLAGIRPPAYMQGSAFAGSHPGPERTYNFGFRGRMDERYDLVRSVRDKRYVYIRNYMPHKVYGQHIDYMFQTPTTAVWKKLYDEGKLEPPMTYFWETKPPEELYDLDNDRDEVKNLAKSPEHRQILQRLRGAQQEWTQSIRDVGFLPESEIHSRSKGSTPYEMGHDEKRYPLRKIMETAELASGLEPGAAGELTNRLADSDSAVRYWAAMGLLMRESVDGIKEALSDSSPNVRAVAAEALGRYGGAEDLKRSLEALMELVPADKNGAYVSLLALNALESLGGKATPVKAALRTLELEDKTSPARARGYGKTLAGNFN